MRQILTSEGDYTSFKFSKREVTIDGVLVENALGKLVRPK